jgi:thiol-disulfide isomerase/thioredoxin
MLPIHLTKGYRKAVKYPTRLAVQHRVFMRRKSPMETIQRLGLFLASVLAVVSSAPALAGSGRNAIMRSLHLDSMNVRAEDFAFKDLDGHEQHLKDLVGKPLILHLWASWCTSCAKELPELGRISTQWARDGVVFLPVSVDSLDKKPQVVSFLAKFEPKIPFWMVVPSSKADAYWSWGLPITYFIDSSGKIVARAMGERDWTSIPAEKLRLLFKTGT